MRGKAIFAVLVTLFMMTPVQAGEVSAQCRASMTTPNNRRRAILPCTSILMEMNQFWSHFSDNENDSVAEWC